MAASAFDQTYDQKLSDDGDIDVEMQMEEGPQEHEQEAPTQPSHVHGQMLAEFTEKYQAYQSSHGIEVPAEEQPLQL